MGFVAKNVVRLELQGANELSNALISLPAALRRQVLKKAVTKAARVMVPPLRRATPKSKTKPKTHKNPPGTTRKSTGVIVRKYKTGELMAAYIGHRWPKGAAAHLIEKGTAVRKTKRGANRGRMPATPFFRPVAEATKSRVMAVLREEMAKGINDAALKALKKFVAKVAK